MKIELQAYGKVNLGNQIALAFHPELSDDTRIHQMFLDMIK